MRHLCLIVNNYTLVRLYILLFLKITFLPILGYSQVDHPEPQLKVGVYQNPPKIFINEVGEPDGIFIEILELIAQKEDISITYQSGEWEELIEALSGGTIDLLPDVAYSQERDSLFQLNSVPVMSSWLEAYALKDTNVQSIFDLENKRLGVLKGSVQEDFLQQSFKNNLKFKFDILTFEDYPESVKALENKQIDLLIASRFFLFSEHINGNIISTGIIFRPSELHFAFSRSTDPALVSKFDRHLSKLKNNTGSKYYKILRYWFDPPGKSFVPKFILWSFVVLLLALLIITIYFILLRYQIKIKTKALWKKNRQLTLAKEKAEESERLKTIFLQNMSHEIRTPMNGIIGFLELLKEPDLDSDERKKYIEIVIKSGQRLLTTINNIIEISKIDSDQISVKLTPINAPETMDFFYQFFKPKAREKDIELIMNHNLPTDKAIFMADKFIFDNILTNLLNNAIKFTDNGYVEFGNYFENDKLIFYVKDSGVGVPEERQQAIFERFVQANLNITRPHEGSGLGLSIVKAYVKALNGKIWLESELNKGSTFYFSIPYIKPVPNEEEEKPKNNSRVLNKKLCIVVAEDDNISYLFINQILKRPEIQVIRAKTGQECVDILQKKSGIDLVLMDIKMPVMNGIEATSAIREFNKTVPIIIQTAYTSSRDKDEAMEAGGTDYITKPIDKNRLLQLIRKYT
ncbi:response regulator [Salinimicrobium gaetbulicola]|uniref:histidine kinase n=1 Tax=Salinimicrobium gaetbulicola TaxID=999702 RepID=A0ABW3ID95_9FLAO